MTEHNDKTAPRPRGDVAKEYLERRRRAQEGPTTWADETPPAVGDDTLWRALTRGGEVRLLAIRATETAREAARHLDASPDVAKLIGEWLVSALLMRQCLNPDERLQFYVNHQGPVGQIVVDAWEEGGARIYVKSPQEVTEAFGFLVDEGNLTVSRTFGHQSYRSTVELAGKTVAEFAMHYLQDSEQIVSLLVTDVRIDDDGLTLASGFLLQLMPDGKRDDIARLLENLERLAPIGDHMTAEDPDARAWASRLMQGFLWDQVARVPVQYECRCSLERMVSMIATLPKNDIYDLSQGSEPLQMLCDFCRSTYEIRPVELKVLLSKPS